MKGTQKEKPNRLIDEKSPYLLQHAYNPVNWYPWSEEAFRKAKNEDKPVFLSIGYASCHWCHVMEKESFEDPKVAKALNDAFVCIKVDREERPDIDAAYMDIAIRANGSGGWPLSVFMTPQKKPFFITSYVPREDGDGVPGILTLTRRIDAAWKRKRKDLDKDAERFYSVFNEAKKKEPALINAKDILRRAYQELSDAFDGENGGFGTAPKFPPAGYLLFLMRYWKRYGEQHAMDMVNKTLEMMRTGGIFDHIGGGFHRYTLDAAWLVPHFEKLLYDQALLSVAYTEAYLITKNPDYKKTVIDTLNFVLKYMSSERGGFYSSKDADSEGTEGKFYMWTYQDLLNAVGPADADLVAMVFNITREGNFLERRTNEGYATGKNILNMRRAIGDVSSSLKMEPKVVHDKLVSAMDKMRAYRDKRVPPDTDDKVLTDMNGLLIAALALAGRVFGEARFVEAAEKAADFIMDRMTYSGSRLYHSYAGGEASIPAFLDDYAFFIHGLLELYETTFKLDYLKAALRYNGSLSEHFLDTKAGGFYYQSDDAEIVLTRKKYLSDGVLPSGNSMQFLNSLRLWHFTDDRKLKDTPSAMENAFSSYMAAKPTSAAFALNAINFKLGPVHEIVIVEGGDPENAKTLAAALGSAFVPNKVSLLKSESNANIIKTIADFTEFLGPQKGRSTVYVCSNYSCKMPTSDPHMMLSLLEQ